MGAMISFALALDLALALNADPVAIDDDAAYIERCEVVCGLQRGAMARARCCAAHAEDLRHRDLALTLGAAALNAQAIAEATSDEDAREAALAHLRLVWAAVIRHLADRRSIDEIERRARAALDLALPPSLADDPKIDAARSRVQAAATRALLRELPSPTRRGDLQAVDRYLQRATIHRRIAAIHGGGYFRLKADRDLHQAFIIAVELHRPYLVCPTLLAADHAWEPLRIDAMICRGDRVDRADLRATLRALSVRYPADVEVWRRAFKLYEPLKIAAITTGVLGIAAGASALLLDQRYQALCGHLSAEGGCAVDETPQASATRQASVVFSIAAPALLVTSVALFVHHARERRARRWGLCSFGVGGGRQSAAIGASCRF